MYARFFRLKQEPFAIAPDPRFLFMSERHREALAHLLITAIPFDGKTMRRVHPLSCGVPRHGPPR